jgi:hypothetical protein
MKQDAAVERCLACEAEGMATPVFVYRLPIDMSDRGSWPFTSEHRVRA